MRVSVHSREMAVTAAAAVEAATGLPARFAAAADDDD